MPQPISKHLLVAINDVGPRFERKVDILRAHLSRHVPFAKIAMLVVPNHWGEAPLITGPGFARRLRSWADDGADVFAHGWFHRDTTLHGGAIARLKPRRMTAGEGEFLGLDVADARTRMIEGRILIGDVIGRPVTGFVAPAWLYGNGARAARRDGDFALAEDHWRVWRPVTDEIACRGPVLTWASRSRPRIASSLIVARVLPPLLRNAPIIRVAVHPGDTRTPSLMASIARSLDVLSRSHAPAGYADLLPESPSCAF